MRRIERTGQFKRDYKRETKGHRAMGVFKQTTLSPIEFYETERCRDVFRPCFFSQWCRLASVV